MLINLTPHELKIHGGEGVVSLPPSGQIARCSVTCSPVGEHDGVPLSRSETGAVEGLPEPQDGVIYVVSMVVRSAVPGRTDVASPGALLRDAEGRPIGCQGLVIN